MKIARDTKWFMFPKDAHTNEVIAEALRGLHNAENFSEIECADGVRRGMFEAPAPGYSTVARLSRSQATLYISFVIYRSQGNGKPSPWEFPAPKKKNLDQLMKLGKVKPAIELKR